MSENDTHSGEQVFSAEARKVLLQQARAINLKVDMRWSTKTLAEEVQMAQEIQKEEQTQSLEESRDTWVILQKDAFLYEDEKELAGSIILVPEAIAERWYDADVAKPSSEAKYEAKLVKDAEALDA